ncbi:MAG TPA: universal stress protein, partial [Clostridiales bacterium]|nr:universal stress protein [Clostridiales bacterium]
FDLIVMGNRGLPKFKRFFVGSVTQKVISEAPCPVLVIRSNFEP